MRTLLSSTGNFALCRGGPPRGVTSAAIVAAVLCLSAVAVGIGVFSDARINWTSSMPRGVYLRVELSLKRGSLVGVCLEGQAARVAHERGYVIRGSCPSGLMPIFKRIAAVPGERVSVRARGVFVNGELFPGTQLATRDSRGRPLIHASEGDTILGEGRYFVLGLWPETSFDSRYFGPVDIHQIVGEAKPLWVF